MLTPRLLRTLARWVTLAAMLLASGAPALSQALAAYRGDLAPWSVVCSAGQARADTSHLSGVATVFEHCPFCALQGQDMAPPPALPALALPPGRAALPALFLQAPRPLFAWAAAQPRGPPRS